jgi:uncharacterized protein involved in type VI secretion and phage assembly
VSSAIEDAQERKHAYYAPEHGKVVDNADPEGLHRVRIEIPGLVEKTAWAYPIGSSGGGSAQRGAGRVPDMGADVIVWFIGGDIERPIYAPGWWTVPDGERGTPTEVKAVPPAEAHQVASIYEGRRLKVWVDERDGKQQLGVQDKDDAGADGTFLSIDLESGTITIQAGGAGLILKSLGLVKIEGAQVTINERLVDASDRVI